MSRHCTGKEDYFKLIQPKGTNPLKKNPRPAWLREFLAQKDPQRIDCGTYKIVYKFKNTAVAIEKGEKPNPPVFSTFKFIPQKYQKHLIYPTDVFVTKGFTVSRLSLCPNGDLFSALYEPRGRWDLLSPAMFVDLAETLDYLHSRNICIVDLKPENIMLCTCNCLAFIDLDSAKQMDKPLGKVMKTMWWNPIALLSSKVIKPRDYFVSDWVAMALVVVGYMGELLLKTTEVDALSQLHAQSQSRNDCTYKLMKPSNLLKLVDRDDIYYDAVMNVNKGPFRDEMIDDGLNLLRKLFVYDWRSNTARFRPNAGNMIRNFQTSMGLRKSVGAFRLSHRTINF